jgi:hypothetical protein
MARRPAFKADGKTRFVAISNSSSLGEMHPGQLVASSRLMAMRPPLRTLRVLIRFPYA